MSVEKKTFLSNLIQSGSIGLFFIWLLFCGQILCMMDSFVAGSDVLLAFVLGMIHIMVSLLLLAGGRSATQSLWYLMNLFFCVFLGYFIYLHHIDIGLIFAVSIVLVSALILYIPANFLRKDLKAKKAKTSV